MCTSVWMCVRLCHVVLFICFRGNVVMVFLQSPWAVQSCVLCMTCDRCPGMCIDWVNALLIWFNWPSQPTNLDLTILFIAPLSHFISCPFSPSVPFILIPFQLNYPLCCVPSSLLFPLKSQLFRHDRILYLWMDIELNVTVQHHTISYHFNNYLNMQFHLSSLFWDNLFNDYSLLLSSYSTVYHYF